MTEPQTAPPRFVIVNTCDCPQPTLIAQYVEGVGYCYMNQNEDKHKARFNGMMPSRPTPIADFGFDIEEYGDEIRFRQVRESVATYEDGKPRKWQSWQKEFSLRLVKLPVKAKRKRKAA